MWYLVSLFVLLFSPICFIVRAARGWGGRERAARSLIKVFFTACRSRITRLARSTFHVALTHLFVFFNIIALPELNRNKIYFLRNNDSRVHSAFDSKLENWEIDTDRDVL